MLYLNGIDAVTGDYLFNPMDYGTAAEAARSGVVDAGVVAWLKSRWRHISERYLGLPDDVDPAVPSQAGWAVVFHKDESAEVRSALGPLIQHRMSTIPADRIKTLEYHDGEGRAAWLARHKVGAGTVDPARVPYYLLLIGSPERISFLFEHLLSVEYAVGRLDFDTPAEYTRYVESIIAYERSKTVPTSREAVLFAARHPFDRATRLSADLLVKPLREDLAGRARDGLRVRELSGDTATKAALLETLSPRSTKPPSVLFTASHGIGWPRGHKNQLARQGALLCQDWPGPGATDPSHYVAAADITGDARVHGMITFHFACYGAGTPAHDRFIHRAGVAPRAIADNAFVAALPRALLAHPSGGALACVGKVERAWTYSIVTPNAGAQLQPFRNFMDRILSGKPIGYALRDFRDRYAALSTALTGMLEEVGHGAVVADEDLTLIWIERNDAEGYVILGDPSVALRVSEMTP